jgi:MerR family transcriptional regulator, heat shock protein HspR
MYMKRKKGHFSISAVAEMFSVHQQTIRLYEKEGLITPKRSEGNTRLFAEEDIDKLEEIIYLTHQLGINLAGVEMIMKLQKQIRKLQKEINHAFNSAHEQLAKEEKSSKASARLSAHALAQLKKTNPQLSFPKATSITTTEGSDKDHWEVEYEDEL